MIIDWENTGGHTGFGADCERHISHPFTHPFKGGCMAYGTFLAGELRNMNKYLRWSLLAASLLMLIALLVYFGLPFAGARSEEASEQETPGPIYHVGEIVTDLAPASNGISHFIQVDMKLRCSDRLTYTNLVDNPGKAKTEILAAIRSMTAEAVMGEAGMEPLRTTIVNRLGPILYPGKITDIYFIEFLVQ